MKFLEPARRAVCAGVIAHSRCASKVKNPAFAALIVATTLVAACATPERLELPVKLPLEKTSATVSVDWQDERPLTDRKMSEVPTAAGIFVTLGDDIAAPSVIDYLRNRIETESAAQIVGKTIRIKRLRVTAEGRNGWVYSGTRVPSTVPIALWELKQMPTEYKSRVEAHVLLEIDGRTFEGRSLIPFERQPSSSDIINAIKVAVDSVTRQLAR
jgi:hypothetical protein